jgi:hypothetical protein
MLYGNRYRWKASLQDMTGKQIANAAEKNEHHVRCPNICRNEMIFVERLGALIIHSSSKQEYTVRAAPQILCSLNLYTLWLFLIHIYICIIDISKPLTFWFFDMFWFCLSWNYCDCRSWNLFWWFWLMCFTKMKTEKTKLTLRFNEAISKLKEAGLCHTPTTFANTSTDFPHTSLLPWVYFCWGNLTCPLISYALPSVLLTHRPCMWPTFATQKGARFEFSNSHGSRPQRAGKRNAPPGAKETWETLKEMGVVVGQVLVRMSK